MKNDQLVENFSAQLETGKAFIYGITPTSNANQMQLEIAQRVQSKIDGGVNFNAVSLGWTDSTIIRHWQGVAVTQLEKMGGDSIIGKTCETAYASLFDGEVIPVSIKTEQYTKTTEPVLYKQNVVDPTHSGRTGASALENPTTKMVLTHKGDKIYRKTSLVQGVYNAAEHSTKLVYDTANVAVGETATAMEKAPAIA